MLNTYLYGCVQSGIKLDSPLPQFNHHGTEGICGKPFHGGDHIFLVTGPEFDFEILAGNPFFIGLQFATRFYQSLFSEQSESISTSDIRLFYVKKLESTILARLALNQIVSNIVMRLLFYIGWTYRRRVEIS